MDVLPVLPCVCALLLLASVQAQAPKHCESPPMMSGSFSVMEANGLFNSYGKISYDNFGQKARVQHAGSSNGTHFNMEVLMLFREKLYYEINWSKFSCKKRALDDGFTPMQVPPDAKLMGQAILGSSSSWGMGVLVNTWYGSLPDNGTYSTVFTEVGCIPLTYTAYSPESGFNIISTFNWVIGNVDPMLYIPPFFCPKIRAEETESPSNFFKILKDFAQNVKDEESV
ncbi:ependymin-like [Eucyclogobius newberryi]|uniref:ependymin-like n=1 Tax=Eucyclogobius newberryi TaxID=166745 RepID=UPI003B595D2C